MYVHCTCVMIATFLSTVRAALVAQMVERKTLNLVVVGSSPTEGVFFTGAESLVFCLVPQLNQHNKDWVAEWSKAPV